MDYEKRILERMMEKYTKRKNGARRVFLRPTELYAAYEEYNADVEIKNAIGAAAENLKEKGFVLVEKIPFSDDIRRMILVEEAVGKIRIHCQKKYGILAPETVASEILKLCDCYEKHCGGTESILLKYIHRMRERLELPAEVSRLKSKDDKAHVRDMLLALDFLEQNRNDLYLREMSMLVYGDSKYFEEQTLTEVIRVIGESSEGVADGIEDTEDAIESDENLSWTYVSGVDRERAVVLLEKYHVHMGEQEIRIKGNWHIAWESSSIDLGKIPGGISLTTQGLREAISVSSGTDVITIENKTSFERMPEDGTSYVYLGGFAGEGVIAFLKMVADQAKDVKFIHFGDIDAGGFFIHRTLSEKTGIEFGLYRMGIAELQNPAYTGCLHPLTENDRTRLQGLLEDPKYCDIVSYMLENNVKLEQEIISLGI